jgi:hypothetical protein
VVFADVVWLRGELYVWRQPPAVAFASAAAKYAAAVPRRLGVELAALCQDADVTYCRVYRPASRSQAEYKLMPDGLKLWIPNPLPRAVVIADKAEWDLLVAQSKDSRSKGFLFG